MKIASAPTFLVTIESTSTQPLSTGTWTAVVLRPGSRGRMMASTAPDRAMIALTTSAAPTMTTISSENPSKARSFGTMPITTPTISAAMATRS